MSAIILFCQQESDLQELYPPQVLICFSYLTGETLEFVQCISVPIRRHWVIASSLLQMTEKVTEN